MSQCSEEETLPSIHQQADRQRTETSRRGFKGLVNLSACYDTNVLSASLLGRHYPTWLQIDGFRGRSHIANTFVSKHISFQFNWSMILIRMLIIVITWRDRVCHKEIWLSFICGIPHLAKLPRLTPRQILAVGDFYLVDVGTFMRHWILMMWTPWHRHRLVTSGSNLKKHFSSGNFEISQKYFTKFKFEAKKNIFRKVFVKRKLFNLQEHWKFIYASCVN